MSPHFIIPGDAASIKRYTKKERKPAVPPPMTPLLSYEDALAHILRAVPGSVSRGTEVVPLREARGRVLAHDIAAGENVPPFDNSAIDGFAVRQEDAKAARPDAPAVLRLTQTIAAGDTTPAKTVHPGEAARIFTGAPMPPGANALVMVEDTEASGETVRLFTSASASLIRRAGSDIQAGQTALSAGQVINAGMVGVLATLSIASVPCMARPRVGLLTTGDELVSAESTASLLPGQIRNSNGPALCAAIEEVGAVIACQCHARDTPEAVEAAFAACQAADSDVIITSGGVSVGDRDFVKAVVEKMGTLSFWRVAVRPGKPLAFGTVGRALFWGLPGNPVSSLVTFELFARPALRKMGGFSDVLRRIVPVGLTHALEHEPGRREFVRVRVVWNAAANAYEATPTGAQGSHRLTSLVHANAFLIAREERGNYEAGETADALLLE